MDVDVGMNDVEWIPNHDDKDDVGILDHHRGGMSLLTPMATHTGMDLVMQDEIVEVDAIQDDENDVVEYLQDEFEVVNAV